jgi:hypothetical protein
MREYQRTTDEQIIEAVNRYMETYPNASRNQIILYATGKADRVRNLAKEGKISLPKPMPSGSKSYYAKSFKYANTA